MTYRELRALLGCLNDEQLDSEVTIFDSAEDEFFPAGGFHVQPCDDVLDEGHPYITL